MTVRLSSDSTLSNASLLPNSNGHAGDFQYGVYAPSPLSYCSRWDVSVTTHYRATEIESINQSKHAFLLDSKDYSTI